jgi:streptogramin lyase
MRLIAGLFLGVLLASCGGSGGGGGTTPTSTTLAAMVDSLGRTVPESDFGGGDGGAAGADGSAGDGAPIANAPVVLTDNAGHTATATTDAQGYYRVSIKGFTPPFVAKVTRSDGTVWFSHSTTPVQTRGFVTMNLTGLTDKVASYVADSANLNGDASKVTPLMLAANPSALQTSKDKLNTGLASPLTYAGLNPATFDAVKFSYQAVKTDAYDKLLERVIVSKDKAKGNTVAVGTFAGVRESFLNGTGAAATFSYVSGVAVDSNGNVFVADTFNHSIRKITPAGVVSTFAGSGSAGFVNGTSTAASFNAPRGLVVDSNGNVFVADTLNHSIRKITPAGVVSTFAGGRLPGFFNGVGTVASFNTPYGVAVDSSGNVFVADGGNKAIRKIAPDGGVSTFAGSGSLGFVNGIGTAASFSFLNGIAVDSSGNMFVADIGNNAIRKITPTGVVSTLAGSGSSGSANGTGTAASFNNPSGVTVDVSGNVFVADRDNQAIRKITPAGFVSTIAGSEFGLVGFADGAGTAAGFSYPNGVTVDSIGNVFVADNNTIRKITPAGDVSTLAGNVPVGFTDGAGTAARFYLPSGVAVDGGGNVFVADSVNHAIRKITQVGVVSTIPGGLFRFVSPSSVALDKNGNVYVTDSTSNLISKVSPDGVVSSFASATAGSFFVPRAVAVDSSGNMYVAGNSAIVKITPAGVVSPFAGGSPGFKDGIGSAASFSVPSGVAVDSNGNVFVADSGNDAIRRITPAGVVSTVAGSGITGFVNGPGVLASFYFPMGVAVDNNGNVFVADTGNNAIRKITPDGVVSTVSGDGARGYTNGTGARFNSPTGVAVDGNGNVFVADQRNYAIRVILP